MTSLLVECFFWVCISHSHTSAHCHIFTQIDDAFDILYDLKGVAAFAESIEVCHSFGESEGAVCSCRKPRLPVVQAQEV